MAELVRYTGQVTTTSNSNLQPVNGRTVLVTKRGATVNGTQTGTSITVFSGALRFANGDKICLHDDETVFATVNGAPANDTTLVVTPSITVTDRDRIINLKSDGGGGPPDYLGYNGAETIYAEPTTAGSVATNNQVTSGTDGEFSFYASPGMYDINILDASGNLSANSETLRDVVLAPDAASAQIYRLGEESTATTGGAIRIVDGVFFPITVAGVNAALQEVSSNGGGTVFVPANAAIPVTTTAVLIPNRCRLVGMGSDFDSGYMFTCSASTNVTAVVANETQDGTQQYASMENVGIQGHASATVTSLILFKQIYDGSYIRNCLVDSSPTKGVIIDGSTVGLGPMTVDNCTFNNSGTNNLHITGKATNVTVSTITANTLAANTSASILTDNTGSGGAAAFGHVFNNVYIETANASAIGLHLDSVSSCIVNGITFNGASAASLVKISGTTSGSTGALARSGHVILNARGNLSTLIDDAENSVTVGNSQSWHVPIYVSPVSTTDADQIAIVGLQTARKGIAIASAATIAPADGNLFEITGTTNITTITNATRYSGKYITLWFSNATPGDVVHGNNIVLRAASNFSPAQNDSITLCSDGTNWIQVAP